MEDRGARAAGAHHLVEDQERLGVQIALGTGPADEEVVRYANEHAIDLAIVQAPAGDDGIDRPRPGVLIERGRCAVLVLR